MPTPKAAPAPRSEPAPKRDSKIARSSSNVKYPSADVPAFASPVLEVDPDQIALLAYSYWEQRGYQPGSALEDWFLAEQRLRTGV